MRRAIKIFHQQIVDGIFYSYVSHCHCEDLVTNLADNTMLVSNCVQNIYLRVSP